MLILTKATNVVLNLNDNSPVKWMSRPTFVKSMLVSDGLFAIPRKKTAYCAITQ